MTRPNWPRLYAKFFPTFTCPASRHVKVISEGLRHKGSDLRAALADFDPDHMAESLEAAVTALWEARKALDDAGYDRVLVRGRLVWRKRT